MSTPDPESATAQLFDTGLSNLSGYVVGIGYGAIISLFCASFGLLQRTARADQKRLNLFLLCYISFMFSLCTMQNILDILSIVAMEWNTTISLNAIGTLQNVGVLLSTWGADCFLMWRCITIYKGSSRQSHRTLKIFISFLVCLLFAASVVVIVKNFAAGLTDNARYSYAFICTSLFINFAITSLIVLRLIYFNRNLKKNLGQKSTVLYSGIIAMSVDSAALIVIFDAIFIIIRRIPGVVGLKSRIFIPIYSTVYIIAPLSIIYRVAQAKTLQPTPPKQYVPDIERSERGQNEAKENCQFYGFLYFLQT
ncbi:hypothetical protein B0H34DRAFT_800023 [Crassisporium funariophilum]|nr:hypothetical protein B0H34DRAFT_800023 [Crassisporium funariophilum]